MLALGARVRVWAASGGQDIEADRIIAGQHVEHITEQRKRPLCLGCPTAVGEL